jgi:membrane fusion protein (multidrug efflux system)
VAKPMKQHCNLASRHGGRRETARLLLIAPFVFALALGLCSCSGDENSKAEAGGPNTTVGVTTVVKKTLSRSITLSSELVPFQEIDVYAKESGYVAKLNVDYGTHVKTGQIMATLEIPELQEQLQEDQA